MQKFKDYYKQRWTDINIDQPDLGTLCFIQTIDPKGTKWVSIAEYSNGYTDNGKDGFYMESCGYDGREYDMVEGVTHWMPVVFPEPTK